MSFTPIDQQFRRKPVQNIDYDDRDRSTALLNKPSAYDYVYGDEARNAGSSAWNPANWSRKTWITSGLGLAVIAAAAIAAGILVSKEERYPDYSKLNYSLVKVYGGTSFFDDFDYFTGYDPSSGFVHYVDSEYAENLNLTYASSSTAILRVDDTTQDDTTGRYSVRITSKDQYNSGLFIFDIVHSPYGCATWPAVWLTDPNNWPEHGEIDVIEAVNKATTGNQMTLHTTDDCTMKVKRKETGTVLYSNCWNETNDNDGCGVKGKPATYGEEFNENGGGIYALEYRTAGIRIWFFDRDSIPSDIDTAVSNTSTTTPDPSSWGEALADFPSTDCDISTHFKNQSIIANIDLCGDWAGATSYYTDKADCPGTCENFVANNASAFSTAYWEFRSFKVYQAS